MLAQEKCQKLNIFDKYTVDTEHTGTFPNKCDANLCRTSLKSPQYIHLNQTIIFEIMTYVNVK